MKQTSRPTRKQVALAQLRHDAGHPGGLQECGCVVQKGAAEQHRQASALFVQRRQLAQQGRARAQCDLAGQVDARQGFRGQDMQQMHQVANWTAIEAPGPISAWPSP